MHDSASRLLQLPDACLEEVLRCCADDPRSLFSGARAHSRLHKAAVLAASSISVTFSHHQQPKQQQLVNGLLQYFDLQGQHVSSLLLDKGQGSSSVTLFELPHDKLQGLSSLSLSEFKLQLLPTRMQPDHGVLGAGVALKQLRLHRCTLLDKAKGKAFAAVLSALPKLEHLVVDMSHYYVRFPMHALQVQLTYLDLADVKLLKPDALRHLQGLTRLQELRLAHIYADPRLDPLQASTVSRMQSLRVLKLHNTSDFELGVLSALPSPQHLELVNCWWPAIRHTPLSELLSHLHSLQLLTCLKFKHSNFKEDPQPPAEAYAALTASSNLQYLDISGCKLPTAAWPHIFQDGRQLPHLQVCPRGGSACELFSSELNQLHTYFYLLLIF